MSKFYLFNKLWILFVTGNTQCSGKQIFIESKCECGCPNEMKCHPPWRPSNLECSCVCDEKKCSGKQVFDKESCSCGCPNKNSDGSCGKLVDSFKTEYSLTSYFIWIGNGKDFCSEDCACKCKNPKPANGCPGVQEWNENKCQCECPKDKSKTTCSGGQVDFRLYLKIRSIIYKKFIFLEMER